MTDNLNLRIRWGARLQEQGSPEGQDRGCEAEDKDDCEAHLRELLPGGAGHAEGRRRHAGRRRRQNRRQLSETVGELKIIQIVPSARGHWVGLLGMILAVTLFARFCLAYWILTEMAEHQTEIVEHVYITNLCLPNPSQHRGS